MAHGDYNAHEKKLLERYDTNKPYGVQNLFHDIHELRENRFAGTDTTFLSCILVDFERLVEKSRMTARQREAVYYHFECDLTQLEVSEIMGVSQQAISKLIDTVVRKVVIASKQEGGRQ